MDLLCQPLAGPPLHEAPASVSLVIPVFNSKASLDRLHQAVAACASSLDRACEIVHVDDGSTDGSLDTLRDMTSGASAVRVITHQRNRGQAKAVLTGIRAAKGQIIVTLDDDLQHQPDDVSRLVAALERASPSTLVVGVADRIKRPLWRGLLGICANAVSNLFLAKRLPLQLTTFCAFRRQLCAYFDPDSDQGLPLMTALVQAAGATRTIPIRLNASLRGGSRYDVAALLRLFLSRSRYYRPSKVMAWGAAAALVALTMAMLAFAGNVVPRPLAAASCIAAAAISFALALLAMRVKRESDPVDLLQANRLA